MPANANDVAAVAYAQNAVPNGDPDHLSSKMCWEAVGYCAYKGGLLAQPPAIMDSKGNFISVKDEKVNGWNGMFNLAAGEVIGFFDLSNKNKEDQLAHIMLCVGKGRAAGSNNGCIGGQNVWQILSLDNLAKLKWDADGVTIDGHRKLEVHHRFLHEMKGH